MAGPSRFKKNADKRPKRNTQSLLFKRKRYCRFTVADVVEIEKELEEEANSQKKDE